MDDINLLKKHLDVSRETEQILENYVSLLLKWNKKINLISPKTENEIWSRHILDSAQLVKYIPSDAKNILDFGSGAGLPGIVLAILTRAKVLLVESDIKKCAFLQEAANLLPNKNIVIINDRIENIDVIESDIITARALASLSDLFSLTDNFIYKTKICLFLKGENIVEEIKDVENNYQFDYKLYNSLTNPKSFIIEIKNFARR